MGPVLRDGMISLFVCISPNLAQKERKRECRYVAVEKQKKDETLKLWNFCKTL